MGDIYRESDNYVHCTKSGWQLLSADCGETRRAEPLIAGTQPQSCLLTNGGWVEKVAHTHVGSASVQS
jgi:hypothetical protein